MYKLFLSPIVLLFLVGCASNSTTQVQTTDPQESSQSSSNNETQAENLNAGQPFVLEISESVDGLEATDSSSTFYLYKEEEIFYGRRQVASTEEDTLCLETYSDENEIWGESESLDISGMRLGDIANKPELLEYSSITSLLAETSRDKPSLKELDTLFSQLPIRSIPQPSEPDEATLTFTEMPNEITISVSVNESESYTYNFSYAYHGAEELVDIPEDDCTTSMELNTGDEATPNFEAVTQSIATP